MGISQIKTIIIKFKEPKDFEINGFDFTLRSQGKLNSLLNKFGKPKIGPAITSISKKQIQELMDEAKTKDKNFSVPNLLLYFKTHINENQEISSFVTHINELDTVEFAYTQGKTRASSTCVNYAQNGGYSDQTYLSIAPEGVDALYAWTYSGACGRNITVVDIEKGWKLDHEDLQIHNSSIVGLQDWVNVLSEQKHGTQVLGIIKAKEDAISRNSRVGLAPNAVVRLISHIIRDETQGTFVEQPVGDALCLASRYTLCGDVILIEVEKQPAGKNDYLPIEYDKFEYDVINVLGATGRIVVEPAGNSSEDLAMHNPNFADIFTNQAFYSKAIMVGGCYFETTANRQELNVGLNYGKRIDTYGGSHQVATLGTNPQGQSHEYISFSKTSAAAAIITGVILIIQGIVKRKCGSKFHLERIRDILHSNYNTPVIDYSTSGSVGYMPNLRNIIINNILDIQCKSLPLFRKLCCKFRKTNCGCF